MTIELLYTSAAQGLKQGSRGFCTVLCTAGLPINLAQRLEALSGYRHVYQPGDQRDDENPVCHSHIRLTVGGKSLSILSRIAAYGVDYSQRTNKIAHHVVIDGPAPPCGPAAVLTQSGVMRTTWDGVCNTFQNGPEIAPIDFQPATCQVWKRITGDAGWANVIVNAWLQPSSKPVWIIFSESQSSALLELMREAISILPESRRWQATFSTYYTNLPPDVDCRVRCVIAGSDEARMSIARGTVLNLTKPMGVPPQANKTEVAMTGSILGGEETQQEEQLLLATPAKRTELSPLANEDRNSEFSAAIQEHFNSPPPLAKHPDKSRSNENLTITNGNSIYLRFALAFVALAIALFSLFQWFFSSQTPADNVTQVVVHENKNPEPQATVEHTTTPPDLVATEMPIPQKNGVPQDLASSVSEQIEPSDSLAIKEGEVSTSDSIMPAAIPSKSKLPQTRIDEPVDKNDSQPVDSNNAHDTVLRDSPNRQRIQAKALIEIDSLMLKRDTSMRVTIPLQQWKSVEQGEQFDFYFLGTKGKRASKNSDIEFDIPLNRSADEIELPNELSASASTANSWLRKAFGAKSRVIDAQENVPASMLKMESILAIAIRQYVGQLKLSSPNEFKQAAKDLDAINSDFEKMVLFNGLSTLTRQPTEQEKGEYWRLKEFFSKFESAVPKPLKKYIPQMEWTEQKILLSVREISTSPRSQTNWKEFCESIRHFNDCLDTLDSTKTTIEAEVECKLIGQARPEMQRSDTDPISKTIQIQSDLVLRSKWKQSGK